MKELFIEKYYALKEKLGKKPSSKEFYENTGVTRDQLAAIFPVKPYSSLVKECGDVPNKFGSEKTPLNLILKRWGNLARKLGRIPLQAEWKVYVQNPTVVNIRKTHAVTWTELPYVFQKEFNSKSQWQDVLQLIPQRDESLSNIETKLAESECYVYLMKDLRNNSHKIGISNDAIFRERTLQSQQPKIELVAKKKYINRKIAGAIEKALHSVYQHKHLRGEWFRLDEEDLKELKSTLNE